VKLIYKKTDHDLPFPAQCMFVVPKRSFKKSPDRNLLKRRMKEVYRLSKTEFYNDNLTKSKKYLLAFIYVGKKEEEYGVIEKAILKLLDHLKAEK
jgi:ribonuclease P protein component